ncbi:unnamed protein product [Leptidea sinapis]|uniref:Mediator of RNA polymerase II transcription subunit 13 n=1 Tax=Leptidea sinapis TaxID=189913 RepID=A0A5E4PVC3_9NEOP|nr:unnamed protein product [Leptidea sinapis]
MTIIQNLISHIGSTTFQDWSYVFKPATVYKYVGSSKYAPLSSLPSQLLPPVSLPPHAVYRPRWQHDREREPEPSHGAAHLADDAGANTNSTSGAGGAGGVKRPLSAAGRDRSVGSVAAGAAGAGAECERAAAPACPLLVNVLLADTVLNVFRDHNFDSCTLCVCNAAGRSVGNIRGADASTYLPGVEWGSGADDEPTRCSCGFSAVVNRRLAHRAGLFYECHRSLLILDRKKLLTVYFWRILKKTKHHRYSDGGAAAMCALRAAAGGALASTNGTTTPHSGAATPTANGSTTTNNGITTGAVHRWPFIGARAPRSSRDVVRFVFFHGNNLTFQILITLYTIMMLKIIFLCALSY